MLALGTALLCAGLGRISEAETIILKGGRRIEGKITKRTETSIRIERDGIGLTYGKDQIERIEPEAPAAPAPRDDGPVGLPRETKPPVLQQAQASAVPHLPDCDPWPMPAEDDPRWKYWQPYILEALQGLKDPKMKLSEGASLAFEHHVASKYAKVYADQVTPFLRDPKSDTRSQALYILEGIGAGHCARAIVPLLADPDERVRRDARIVLNGLKAKGTITVDMLKQVSAGLTGLLSDSNPSPQSGQGIDADTRRQATQMLVQIDPATGAQQAAKELEDPDPLMRAQAILALGKLGAKEYLSQIAKHLTDEHGNPQEAATRVLADWGAKEYAPQIASLMKPGAWASVRAIEALVKLDAREQAGAIAQLMQDDPHFTVRIEAIRALAKFQAVQHVPDLVRLLKIGHQTDDRAYGKVRGEAARALARLGAKECAGDIAELLADKQAQARASAIKALGELGAVVYADEITALLSDPEEVVLEFWDPKPHVAKVKDIASELLRSWGRR